MGVINIVLIFCCICVLSCMAKNNGTEVEDNESRELGKSLFEQGRTLVRNSLKRFMILLPAVFFKLGIAFTMLVLVTIVSVNNGFIGFLLLVVGLSSVLARFQEVRRSPAVPYVNALPVYQQAKYIQDWDRKNRAIDIDVRDAASISPSIYAQHYVYPQLSAYYKPETARV